jgi:hypothetical protein
MPPKTPPVTPKQDLPVEAPSAPDVGDVASRDQKHVPFDQVLRRLVDTKAAQKGSAGPAKRNARKPPRKA